MKCRTRQDRRGYFQTPVVWWKEGFSQTRFLCTMQYFGSSSLLMAFLLLCFAALKVKVELERIDCAAFWLWKFEENRHNRRGLTKIDKDQQRITNIEKTNMDRKWIAKIEIDQRRSANVVNFWQKSLIIQLSALRSSINHNVGKIFKIWMENFDQN